MVNKRILCDHCRGSGAASSADIHTCTGCNGQGVKVVRQQIFPGMFSQAQVSCNECGGRGKIIKRQCPHCQGAKVLDHTQRYTLEVPRGTPEAHEIVFEGEADESPDYEAGDIVIRVRSKKNQGGFRRKESGLYWKETISVDEASWSRTVSLCTVIDRLIQALLGFERNLTHLDGHVVPLKRQSVTQPGKVFILRNHHHALICVKTGFVQTIKGEGMPIFGESGHGDLYVEYNVVLPNKLSPQMRKRE